jgi:molybdate transport system ATP-binding protein
VLLLDEPFAAVDRATRRRLQDDLDGLRRALQIPFVLVTHDFDDVVRLATHVLLLERGRSVASGPIAELTSRPDLPWLREAVGLGSVFDAMVAQAFPERGLVEIAFEGGTLLAASRSLAAGAAVRVRLPAREVILATTAPHGLSLHNVLAGTVTALDPDPSSAHVIVQLAIGGSRLLAEVTQDAVSTLRIAPGVRLHALIKSVSIQMRNVAAAP